MFPINHPYRHGFNPGEIRGGIGGAGGPGMTETNVGMGGDVGLKGNGNG
jgi:hypothetical protein